MARDKRSHDERNEHDEPNKHDKHSEPDDSTEQSDNDLTHEPQGEGKATSPTDIHRAGWLVVFKRAARQFGQHQVADIAAGLTYFAVLALFPAILAILSLLSVIGQNRNVVDGVLEIVGAIAPGEALDLIEGPVRALAEAPGAGIALVIGVVGAIWSASGFVGSFGRGMNRIYGVAEGRTLVALRIRVLLVTLFAVISLAVMALLLVVSGPIAEAIGSLIGLGSTSLLVWNIVKWPVLVVLAALVIAVLYYYTPNVKQAKFRWVSVGAVVGLVVWGLATAGFFFYAINFSNYGATYGSLGGIIIFLLWIYISNMALLFGAEVDAELERVRQLQAGVKAEYALQIALRDTTMIDKQAEIEAAVVLEARTLRTSRGTRADD